MRIPKSRDHRGWLRQRWLPVATWGISILTVVVVAIPMVMTTMRDASEHAKLVDVRTSVLRSQGLIERLEKSDPVRLELLNNLRSRLHQVGDEEAIRGQWLQLIRQHDGRIRQLEIRQASHRPWGGVEDSIENDQYEIDHENPSEFTLHWQNIVLRMEGSFDSVRKVVRSILANDPIATINQLIITPMPQRGGVELQLELRLYGLTPNEPSTTPMVARKDQTKFAGAQF